MAGGERVIVTITEMKSLLRNWDSYGAEPPNEAACTVAESFLDYVGAKYNDHFVVKPSAVGGIGFTFRSYSRSVYVEFRNTGNCHAVFMGRRNPQVVRVEQTDDGFQDILRQIESHLVG